MLEALQKLVLDFSIKCNNHQNNKKNEVFINQKQLNICSKAIQQIGVMQRFNPKIFAKQTSHLLLQVLERFASQQDSGVIYPLYETLYVNIQNCPTYYNKNMPLLLKYILLICFEISKILPYSNNKLFSLEHNEDAIQDYDQFEESHPQSALILKYCDCIAEIVENPKLKFQIICKQLYHSLKSKFQEGNSIIQSSICLCIAQLYGLDKIEKLQCYLQLIYHALGNSDGTVRFTSLVALSNIIKNYKQKFQKKYSSHFLPIVYKGFLSETEQEVAGQWVGCFNILIDQQEDYTKILPYLQAVTTRIFYYIKNITTIQILNNSLQTLVSLSSIFGVISSPILSKFIEIYLFLLEKKDLQNQMINKACQSLTKFVRNLDFQCIDQYAQFSLNKIWQMSDKISIITLVKCWRNLCDCGKQFVNWKYYYKKIDSFCFNKQHLQNDEKIISIEAVQATVSLFQTDFGDLSQKTFNKLFLQLQNISWEEQENFSTFQIILATINTIIESAKIPYTQTVHSLLLFCLQNIIILIQNKQWEIKQEMLKSIKIIIGQYFKIMSPDIIQFIVAKFWGLVAYFRTQKAKMQQIQGYLESNIKSENNWFDFENDSEQPQPPSNIRNQNNNQILSQNINLTDFDCCRLILPQILTQILKNSKNKTVLVQNIIQQISIEHKNKTILWDIHQIMLYICALIEEVQYELIKQYWREFTNFLISYAKSQNHSLRQTISFTVGLMAQKMPLELTNNLNIQEWIQTINNCFSVPLKQQQKQTEFQEDYKFCQDNCISALGKIIVKYNKFTNVSYLYDTWLTKLPLLSDDDQNKIQINYLCEILNKEPQMLISQSNSNSYNQKQNCAYVLTKILKIFAKLKILFFNFTKSKINKQLYFNSKKTIQTITGWNIFKQNQIKIIEALSQQEKTALQEFTI